MQAKSFAACAGDEKPHRNNIPIMYCDVPYLRQRPPAMVQAPQTHYLLNYSHNQCTPTTTSPPVLGEFRLRAMCAHDWLVATARSLRTRWNVQKRHSRCCIQRMSSLALSSSTHFTFSSLACTYTRSMPCQANKNCIQLYTYIYICDLLCFIISNLIKY